MSLVLIPFEIQPRDQLLDRLGLAQVRREDLAGEAEADAGLIDPAVVHPRLANLDRPAAGQKRPRRLVAIADDQPMTGGIDCLLMGIDIAGHFLLDRVLQHAAGALAGDVFQDRLGCQPQFECG
jgi:hypothetical protein